MRAEFSFPPDKPLRWGASRPWRTLAVPLCVRAALAHVVGQQPNVQQAPLLMPCAWRWPLGNLRRLALPPLALQRRREGPDLPDPGAGPKQAALAAGEGQSAALCVR